MFVSVFLLFLASQKALRRLSEGFQKGIRRVSEGSKYVDFFLGVWDVKEHVFSTFLVGFKHILSVSDRFLIVF